MSYHEELDLIWDKALKESMCECKNDDKWEQQISGTIFCSRCKNKITDQQTETVVRENKRIEKKYKN